MREACWICSQHEFRFRMTKRLFAFGEKWICRRCLGIAPKADAKPQVTEGLQKLLKDFEQAREVVRRIKYKEMKFHLLYSILSDAVELHVGHKVPNVDPRVKEIGGPIDVFSTRVLRYREIPTERALVNEAFEMAKMMEIHEVAEWFEYDGKRIFDPHKDESKNRLAL